MSKKEENKCKENLKDKKDEVKELTEDLQRLQAEFENYKKRVDKEKEDFLKYAKASIIDKLLPVLDSFEIALKNDKDHAKFKKGMEMIYAQFFSLLESEGLRPIKAEGVCDPFKHEVLLTAESDKEEGVILEELQKGYMLKDKVLRHSKVKVSKQKEASAAKEAEHDNKKDTKR